MNTDWNYMIDKSISIKTFGLRNVKKDLTLNTIVLPGLKYFKK